MPDNNPEITQDTPPVIEAPGPDLADVPKVPGGNTPLNGVVPPHNLLDALATPTTKPEAAPIPDVLHPAEYVLVATASRTQVLRSLNAALNSPDQTNRAAIQTRINAISQIDSSTVGNKRALSTFLDQLQGSDTETLPHMGRAVAAARLVTGEQTQQTIRQACDALNLLTPFSVQGVLENIEGTLSQSVHAAIERAAHMSSYQGRVLTEDEQTAIKSGVFAPYLNIIQNSHILTADDLKRLYGLAETSLGTPETIMTRVANDPLVAQLRNTVGQTIDSYDAFLAGNESAWDAQVPNEFASTIVDAINTEKEAAQDLEEKQEIKDRRIQKVKTTGMLFAMLLSLLIYSSMPKGEQQ